MRKLISFLLFVCSISLTAQTPYLVKDLNPDHAVTSSSAPTSFASFKNRIYFNATTAANGTELWSTDGTSGTATLLLDILPGAASSGVAALTVVNGALLFTARDVDHGIELWATDGTAGGTHMLVDINPGPNSSLPSAMFVYGNKMFFSADDGAHGRELWITDGTTAGTHLFKDINPGSASSSPGSFVTFGNSVYFGAANALWKTDGTESGTVQVSAVQARRLLATGTQLFFEGFTQATGWEPWVTDGTAAATHMITDLFPGTSSSFDPTYDTGFTLLGNGIIFPANDGTHGREIWVSDGTETGTHILRDFVPGAVGMFDTGLPYLTSFAGKAFFGAADPVHGNELWVTDGTDAGTSLFDDATAGPTGSVVTHIVVAGGNLFWTAGSLPPMLWVTDGTVAGTHTLGTSVGLSAGNVNSMQAVDGKLYFAGNTPLNGSEPWVSDGTEGGTRLLANVAADDAPSSSPKLLTAVGNQLFFIAQTAPSPFAYVGTTLWRSDGTAAGTIPLTRASENTIVLLAAGSQLLMDDAVTNWTQSDGTVSGTKAATELLSRFGNPLGSSISHFYPFGDRLYVSVLLDSYNTMLWKTKIDANAPAVSLGLHNVQSIIEAGGRQYTMGQDGFSTTDGTPAGTYSIYPDFGSNGGGPLAYAGGTIYFLQTAAGDNSTNLWKSDGTFDGTSVIKTLPGLSYPSGTITASGRRIYFFNGGSLWTSDGTADGTVALTTMSLSGFLSNPLFPASGERLVFVQDDPVARNQIWITDGTATGTKLVMTTGNVVPNPASIDGQVWFNGVDTAHGTELWVTDGTTAGTRMVADINPGAGSSRPSSFTKLGNVLYFSANTDATGTELWALPLTDPLLNIGDTRVAEGNSGNTVARFNVTLSAPATQAVTVQYATADGTAHSGQDYDSASGTLTFAPGETTKSIDVNIHGDSDVEGNETFFVTLQNATGGARVATGAGTGIIEDDDQNSDLSVEHIIDDLYSPNSVNVKNNGPSGVAGISVSFTSTPMRLQYCPPCTGRVPQLATGASAKLGGSGGQFTYASATVSARQRDPRPDNNQTSWSGSFGISMDSAYLTPGKQATITAGVTFLNVLPAVTSSDPSVVSVSAPVFTGTGGDRVVVIATGVKPGSATVTIGSNTLPVLVSAAGTLPKWPGAISYISSAVVYFDQPAQFTIQADGTAPFTGVTGTGTVTVFRNGQLVSQKSLPGPLTYAEYPPSLGPLSYQVQYSGDATFQPQTLNINFAMLKGRATLTALLEPVPGQPGSYSLKVGAAGSPVAAPSGTLSIRNGSTEIANLTLSPTSNGNAAAQKVLTNLPASPTLTIVYSGDPLYDTTTTSVRSLQLHHRGVRP